METIKVLLIEDGDSDAEIIRVCLDAYKECNYDVERLTTLAEVAKSVRKSKPHVVVLDLNLLDSSGIQTFHDVKALVNGTPIIILSGLSDLCLAREALKNGAQDYIVKDHTLPGPILPRAIVYALERKKLLTELNKIKDLHENTLCAIKIALKSGEKKVEEVLLDLIDMEIEKMRV